MFPHKTRIEDLLLGEELLGLVWDVSILVTNRTPVKLRRMPMILFLLICSTETK